MAQAGAKQIREKYVASDGSLYLSPAEIKTPALTYTIDASLGTELKKKFVLSVTYQLPTSIGNFIFYTPELSCIQMRVGYKL